jgi:hypothetical protein
MSANIDKVRLIVTRRIVHAGSVGRNQQTVAIILVRPSTWPDHYGMRSCVSNDFD